MSKSVLHVVPHNQEWAVKREGNERSSSTHPTQKEAIESARELAKELDDIVIHRPDGTIRERVTYYGTNGQAHAEGGETRSAPARAAATTTTAAEVRPQDVVGVGSRVSWAAVLAGAATALAAYVTLSLFALALGLSVSDQMWGRNFTVTAVLVSALLLILSLFLGGYVASCTTSGERPTEAGIYGVLVWGVVFVLLLWGGLGFGFGHLGGLRQLTPADGPAAVAERTNAAGPSAQQEQRNASLVQAPASATPVQAAWWAFGGVALSLLASIAGGWVGAGPEPAVRTTRETGPAAVAVPRPA
jgi:hypothetical protein